MCPQLPHAIYSLAWFPPPNLTGFLFLALSHLEAFTPAVPLLTGRMFYRISKWFSPSVL